MQTNHAQSIALQSGRRVWFVRAVCLSLLAVLLLPLTAGAAAASTPPVAPVSDSAWRDLLRSAGVKLRVPGSVQSASLGGSGSSLGTVNRVAGTARAAQVSATLNKVAITQQTFSASMEGPTAIRKVGTLATKAGGTALSAAFAVDLGYSIGGFYMENVFGIQSDGLLCDVQSLAGDAACGLVADPEYVPNSDVVLGAPGYVPGSAMLSGAPVGSPPWQFAYSFGAAVAPGTDPYGQRLYPSMTFPLTSWSTVLMGAGTASDAYRVHAVCKVTATGAFQFMTGSGKWAQGGTDAAKNLAGPPVVQVLSGAGSGATVASGDCGASATFYGWALSDQAGASPTAAGLAANLDAGYAIWYLTPGNPGYAVQSADPLRGWLTEWTCAPGGSHSAASAQYRESDDTYPTPVQPSCSSGSLEYVKVTQTDSDASTEPWVLYEWSMPAEVGAWAAAYPECTDGSCLLELHRQDAATGTRLSCFENPEACLAWFEDPAKADTYVCTYGSHVLALDECNAYSVMFDPAKRSAAGTFADPATGAAPAAPAPGTDPGAGCGKAPAFEFTLGGLGYWIAHGTEWALCEAFKPEPIAWADLSGKSPLPEVRSAVEAWQEIEDAGTGSECLVIGFDLPMGWGHVDVLDTCGSDPAMVWLRDNRGLLAAAVWLSFGAGVAGWAWRTYAPGAGGTT